VRCAKILFSLVLASLLLGCLAIFEPRPGPLLFCEHRAQSVVHVRFSRGDSERSFLVAKQCEPTHRVVLMSEIGKVLGEARYANGWVYSEQIPETLPWDQLLNMMNWTDGNADAVRMDLERFNATVIEMDHGRRIAFNASRWIEITRRTPDNRVIEAELGNMPFSLYLTTISEN